MKAFFNKPGLTKLWQAIRPWALGLAHFAILKGTGLAGEVSYAAQTVLLKAGIFDIAPKERTVEEEAFSYDFVVKDMQGNRLNMRDLKGKVIFLNLWATWCGPCRAEMPSIQNLYDAVDKDKVVFVMLSLDHEKERKKVERFISAREFTFPVYQPASPLPQLLRVTTIPTTFIVGPDGKVKHKKIGMANYDTPEMRKFLEQM